MISKKKIVIIGFGGRGNVYAYFSRLEPEKFEIAAIVDTDKKKREKAEEYHCPVFENIEQFLNAGIVADAVIIAIQDKDHFECSVACIKAGYKYILLEKPIACTLDDCLKLSDIAAKYKANIIVCHVLRYTPFYKGIKKVLTDGVIGDIVTLNASENVGYFHQAHSFVRGPWRNSVESTPMILAKCCHDLDIIRWLLDKKCNNVCSFGGLSYFKKENAPKCSADYCTDCELKDCIYNAQQIYLRYSWMASYFTNGETSNEKILEALKYSQFDRCVFKSDNDVVDHQVTIMQFEDGVTASHTMTAFSKNIYRDIKIHGTKGELVGVMENNCFEVRLFDGGVFQYNTEINTKLNHGGGDVGLMNEFYNFLCGHLNNGITLLDVSIDSHKIAFCAEESRVKNKIIELN